MSKYVIKNCPAYNPKHCDCLNTKEIACLYRTNCIMKQIVELCKSTCQDCSNVKRVTYTQCKDLNNCKTAKILKLLDIQETER